MDVWVVPCSSCSLVLTEASSWMSDRSRLAKLTCVQRSITPTRTTPVLRQVAHQLRLSPSAPAAIHNALQQFALALRVRDRLAGIPGPPRGLVHQRQRLVPAAP